jgi:DNA repair protein RadA
MTEKEFELTDIEGIGPVSARKMKENGIFSPQDLASCDANQLKEDGITDARDTAESWINAAIDLVEGEDTFKTALEDETSRKTNIERVTTGSKELDKLLGGGLETNSTTEFYGEFGSGKSQLCHTLCVTTQLPKEQGGLAGSVMYIDTEGTFRPERVREIIVNRFPEKTAEEVETLMKGIVVGRTYNTDRLLNYVKHAGKTIMEKNVKLLIVDSITSLFRAEFIGRGQLSDRQQRLNALVHKLSRIAEYFNIVVVFTNQVLAAPDTFFGDPIKAAGGNVIAHGSTYRIYLKKLGAKRGATFIDSPYHAYSNVHFTVDKSGIVDVEEDTPKKKGKKEE